MEIVIDRDGIELPRPRTRADCVDGPRPCPFASCRHHLYLDILNSSGNLKINHDIAIENLEESCSLDVADRGVHTLEEVGEFFAITRERIRQIEVKALIHLKVLNPDLDLDHPEAALGHPLAQMEEDSPGSSGLTNYQYPPQLQAIFDAEDERRWRYTARGTE